MFSYYQTGFSTYFHTYDYNTYIVSHNQNIFSFICSANNNVPRISKMVIFLSENFGRFVGSFSGQRFYSFPTISDLDNNDLEEILRSNKFGYRSKSICNASKFILKNGGEQYIESLKKMEYDQLHTLLCKIPGIGFKVADCICLMSFNKFNAVPIDVHMLRVAKTKYSYQTKAIKSFSKKEYIEIRNLFQEKWGK